MKYRPLLLTIGLTIISLFATGCVTAPAEYERVADQSVSFQDAYLQYSKSAKELSVHSRAISMATTLVPMEAGAGRLEKYDEYISSIRTGVEVFDAIRDHGSAMRSYFKQFQSMATSDAAKDSKAAAGKTIEYLNSLSESLGANGISAGTGTIVGELLQMGVSIQHRKLLSAELEQNGATIETNILLQIEALSFMEKQVARNLSSTVNELENLLKVTLLDEEEIDGGKIADATVNRVLAESVKPKSASKAGQKLLASWRDLIRRAQGNLTLEELFAALKDLSSEIKEMETTTAAISGLID